MKNNVKNNAKKNVMNNLVSANPPSALPRPARWEALIQSALELWFRTSCRRLVRALHDTRRIEGFSDLSARQCRDIGLPPREPRARDPHFIHADAQLGMFR